MAKVYCCRFSDAFSPSKILLSASHSIVSA
jgi:hypothetical protein